MSLLNPTPEKETTSESESDSSINTNGRQLHAIDTQQQQHNSLDFCTFKIFQWL